MWLWWLRSPTDGLSASWRMRKTSSVTNFKFKDLIIKEVNSMTHSQSKAEDLRSLGCRECTKFKSQSPKAREPGILISKSGRRVSSSRGEREKKKIHITFPLLFCSVLASVNWRCPSMLGEGGLPYSVCWFKRFTSYLDTGHLLFQLSWQLKSIITDKTCISTFVDVSFHSFNNYLLEIWYIYMYI